MAKVYYSALVNYVQGKLGTAIYSKSGKVRYIKMAPVSVAQPNTFRQLQVKSNFCTASKLWCGIPNSHKELWDKRAILANANFFGRQMFIRCNCNILNASHSDLTVISHPPHTPSTPKFPKNFCVFLMSPSSFCLSWSAPHSTKAYITAEYRLHKGFCIVHPAFGLCPTTGYRPSYRFIETVRSDVGAIVFSSPWTSNTRLFFKLHSLDAHGRFSPDTHSILYTQP